MPDQDSITAVAIIPAAGAGTRMGAPLPKQFLTIGGIPVLALTIKRILEIAAIESVIIAVPADRRQQVQEMLASHFLPQQRPRLFPVDGGDTRQQSVRAGLQAVSGQPDIVLVHDGARPFVTTEIIKRCLAAANSFGAAIAAVRVSDTLKRVSDGHIAQTVDRADLWQAQTPQAARTDLLRAAFRLADETGFEGTDEASLLENAGIAVAVVEGSELNFKITRPEDLILAESLQRVQS